MSPPIDPRFVRLVPQRSDDDRVSTAPARAGNPASDAGAEPIAAAEDRDALESPREAPRREMLSMRAAASPTPDPPRAPSAAPRGRVEVPAPIDPSALSLRVPVPTALPTYDVVAQNIAPPPIVDANGQRLSIDAVAGNLHGQSDAIEQVASIIARREDAAGNDTSLIRYVAYGSLSKSRPAVGEAWARGHAECDGIMANAAYLLTASGAVPREDVVVTQTFAYGGWHNVVIFRDPRDGAWKVMDYQNIVTIPGATNREQALRRYFNLQSGVSVVYRIDNPNDRPVALYHVKSSHVAMVDGATLSPGVDRAMEGVYGTNRGLNDGSAARLPHRTDAARASGEAGARGSAVAYEGRGTRVGAAVGYGEGEATRAGAALLHATGEHTALGAKVLFHRNPGDAAGSSLMVAGEWWKVDGGNFVGLVTGSHARVDVLTGHNGEPLTTVAPFIAASGGMTHTFVDKDTVSVEGFWSGHARLTVPIVLGADGRAAIEEASNGLSPGGVIEPGDLVSLSTVGANAGARARVALGSRLSLSGEVAGHTVLTDPTLAPLAMWLPLRGGLDGRLALSTQGDTFAGQLGVQGGVGSLYDRDVRAGAFATGRVQLGANAELDLRLSAGQFVSGTRYGDARAALSWRPGGGAVDLRLSGGATAESDPGNAPRLAPEGTVAVGVKF